MAKDFEEAYLFSGIYIPKVMKISQFALKIDSMPRIR